MKKYRLKWESIRTGLSGSDSEEYTNLTKAERMKAALNNYWNGLTRWTIEEVV